MSNEYQNVFGRENELGQLIGAEVEAWQARQLPYRISMQGLYCSVVPLEPETHGHQLFEAFGRDTEHRNWTYLLTEPSPDFESFQRHLLEHCNGTDPLYFAVINPKTNKAVGIASFMRITPLHGVIEVGNIHFSPLLQRTALATEAMYLMMKRAFDELGYRRYEWKCDSLNEPSRKAALRLGFQFEGVFRQTQVSKGRNRDTAWFAVINSDWPSLKQAFETWLLPSNFDAHGQQINTLKQCGVKQ